MTNLRSLSRKQNHNASAGSNSKTWTCLYEDVLLLIMMQLGPIDFLAFSGVCKSWRSLAQSNKNNFMTSKQPMILSISHMDPKDCYLKDIEGRRFKTVLPNGRRWTLAGLTCGYLIMYERQTMDFWLVHPITRFELHFPHYPFYVGLEPSSIKAILVFSPSMLRWVFVVSPWHSKVISFLLDGEQQWNHITLDNEILDIHFFKGYIYAMCSKRYLCEVRLHPKPTITKHRVMNFMHSHGHFPMEFVSGCDDLFLIGHISTHVILHFKVNFEGSKYQLTKKKVKDYKVFVSDLKGGVAVKPEDFPLYEKTVSILEEEDHFMNSIWYFPHDCLNTNFLK